MALTTVITSTIIIGSTAGAIITMIKLNTIIRKKLTKKAENVRYWFNEPTKKRLDELKKEFKDKDYRDCQTDILNYLVDVENGEKKTEVQRKHIFHLREHYVKNLNGNTYVEDEWRKIFGSEK